MDSAAYKADIKAKLLDLRNNTTDPEAAADALAQVVADGAKTMVQGIIITYTTGLTCSTGPVAGVFNYTIS